MRRLTIQVDADAEHCGNCHRLVVSEDQVGDTRGVDGQFRRVTGCPAAEVGTEGAAA